MQKQRQPPSRIDWRLWKYLYSHDLIGYRLKHVKTLYCRFYVDKIHLNPVHDQVNVNQLDLPKQ